MRFDLPVRAGVVALCVAGVVASAITYRSEHRLDQAFGAAVQGKPLAKTVKLADGSQTLHPDTRADVAKASFALIGHDLTGALDYARTATRREPQNAGNWLLLARVQALARQLPQARASYARAKALDTQLPRTQLPP